MLHHIGVFLIASAMLVTASFAQEGAAVSLSADVVPLGRIVELRVSVWVPPGSAVYFPDELPGTDALESHGAVKWAAAPVRDGAQLTLTYPLIALGNGKVPTPDFDIRIGPAGGAATGPALPGASVIGPASLNSTAKVLAHIAPAEVRVASLFELEGVLGGVGPMPPSDVVGRDWPAAAIIILLIGTSWFLALQAGAIGRWRARLAQVRMPAVPSMEETRRTALGELDDLLALGLHTTGRMREFYARTSHIVRRYVEAFDARWGPNLTSTELMRELSAAESGAPVDVLRAEMSEAEVVKFASVEAEAAAAEAHWRKVRRWVEEWGRARA